MGLSTPSNTCDRTAPTATSEASVSRMHGSPGTGNARVDASSSAASSDRMQVPLHLSI